jgi:hypothetical protein
MERVYFLKNIDAQAAERWRRLTYVVDSLQVVQGEEMTGRNSRGLLMI